MHAMTGLRFLLGAMLLLIEPLHLHRRMATSSSPAQDFMWLERMHRFVTGIATLTLLEPTVASDWARVGSFFHRRVIGTGTLR
jgi:hypothetical protein